MQTLIMSNWVSSGITHPSNPQAAALDIEVSHGQITLARDGTFPVRHGFWFDVRAVLRDPQEDDSLTLIQLHFQSIRSTIWNIQSRLQHKARECMTAGDGSAGSTLPLGALSVAVMPNEPQTFVDPCSALAFFTALQALWQPLAILQPPALPALVPVGRCSVAPTCHARTFGTTCPTGYALAPCSAYFSRAATHCYVQVSDHHQF